MKILMLGWELPPHNSGGLGVACLNLARALARQGADIDFVIPYTAAHSATDFMHILSATPLDPIHRYGGAYLHSAIEEKLIPAHHASADTYLSLRDVQHEYCRYVDEYLKHHHPAVVHAHDWLTYEAGILAREHYNLPLVAHIHATEYDRAGMREGNPIIHEIEREGLMLADQIIAVSESTKRIVHEKYDIPLEKISVVYNSLDEDFLGSPYRTDAHLYEYINQKKSEGCTIITTVGRFTVQKGLHNLMRGAARAIEKDDKLLFIFAGDGELRDELLSLSAKLGISKNVLFTGFIRGCKLRDIYAVSDVFVMSSISEPFGLTALEAAHHGDALILTKQSGVSEVLWSCLKYDFWDEAKLADEILAISQNPALKSTLKTNIHAEYTRISWENIAKKCLKVYNNSIKHKR